MKVRLRLQNKGCKNHPLWRIVVQPAKKNYKGRYLEQVGVWRPRKTVTLQRAMILNKQRVRYWLSVGASCTHRVHKILEKFEFLPKYPTPFGSNSLFPKPSKIYNMDFFRLKTEVGGSRELLMRQKIQEQMNIIQRKQRLQAEALRSLGETGQPLPQLEEIKTTDIESEEVDIFERQDKFKELLKRFDKHRKEYAHLRGNDLRYNVYMKKIQKLTRMDLGLDVEAYKDYINNLKQFAHLNNDFEYYARESLNLGKDDPHYRSMINIIGGDTAEHYKTTPADLHNEARFQYKCEMIHNLLRKFKREASGFVTKRDHIILEDFLQNIREFLRDPYIHTMTQQLYDRKLADQKRIEETKNGLIIDKVLEDDLINAHTSKREWAQIQLLLSVDGHIFQLKEQDQQSLKDWIIDVSKYDNLSKDVKELLYRPNKIKVLYQKYWNITQIQGQRFTIFSKYPKSRQIVEKPRYPPKTAEEEALIQKFMDRLSELIQEDKIKLEQEKLQQQSLKNVKVDVQGNKSQYGAQSAADMLKNRDKSHKDAKRSEKQGDEVSTTELENAFDPTSDEDVPEDYYERHGINMAKLFLGQDGGYTKDELKQFYKKEQKYKREQSRMQHDRRHENEDDIEEPAEQDEPVDENDMEGNLKAKKQQKASDKEGDNEDIKTSDNGDDAAETGFDFESIDDEEFQKLLDQVKEVDFKDEEEAKAYFEKLAIEKQGFKKGCTLKPKREIDHKEKRDPYYAMLKEEIAASSRYENEFILDPDDMFREHEKEEKEIARYPKGFRQYENFQNYKIIFPNATINDYTNDMNRQVEYDEFKQINVSVFLAASRNSYTSWKFNVSDFPESENEELTPEMFVQTKTFDEEMRVEYQDKVQSYLLGKSWFKIVDALEEVTNFWSFGREMFHQPTYNVYMPARHTIFPRPHLGDDHEDDVGFKYNQQRLSPFHTLNPLKSYRMSPAPKYIPEEIYKRRKAHRKWRRLSQTKMYNFSTINTNSYEQSIPTEAPKVAPIINTTSWFKSKSSSAANTFNFLTTPSQYWMAQQAMAANQKK